MLITCPQNKKPISARWLIGGSKEILYSSQEPYFDKPTLFGKVQQTETIPFYDLLIRLTSVYFIHYIKYQ